MTREKITETIKKLLALAASPNENEAKLAMSRAQELLSKYNVKINDSEEEKIEDVVYDADRYVIDMYCNIPKNTLSALIYEICPLFGCASYAMARGKIIENFHIMGFNTNIELTKFAIESILAQAMIDYKQAYKQYRSISFSNGFWTGFVLGIQKRFKEHREQAEGLVLWGKAKAERDKLTGDNKIFTSLARAYGSVAGEQSAQNVQIRKGLESTERGNILT